MKRLNINIRDDTSDDMAIALVQRVIDNGRISNDGKSYCYVTTFRNGMIVVAEVTRAGNDTFHVYRDQRENDR